MLAILIGRVNFLSYLTAPARKSTRLEKFPGNTESFKISMLKLIIAYRVNELIGTKMAGFFGTEHKIEIIKCNSFFDEFITTSIEIALNQAM